MQSYLTVIMGKIYNRKNQKQTRKKLRNNMTKAEVILWSKLRGKQLGYKFRRQQEIGKYVVDFCCPELKLIIEVDGETHGFSSQIRKDKGRQNFLEGMGFIVQRYSNDDVIKNLNGVMDNLVDVIKSISTTPSPSLNKEGI